MEIFKLYGTIIIKDEEALKKLDNVDKKAGNISSSLGKKLSTVGNICTGVGKTLTAGITAPVVGIGVASAKTAMDFQAGMQEVSAISGATGKDLDTLSNLAKEMGRTTKFSATDSAEALKYMGMAGWKTQDMVKGLPGVLNLAAAGGTDLAITSDIVTDGLTAMGLSASDTNKFVDIMAATVTNSNTSIEMMGETMQYAGPIAGTLGINMQDLSVAIGLMGNAGIKASNAGTALRGGLTRLAKPTSEMQKCMSQYGIELSKNKDGSIDLMSTMQNLRDKLSGLDKTTQAQILTTIFGKNAMSGWAAIVNASEGDFQKLTKAIGDSDGKAESMAKTMQEGAKGAITEMKSALEGVSITIGERLLPIIEKGADFISKLCAGFQSLSPQAQTAIMAFVALLAALGPILLIVGGLISFFLTLSSAASVLGIGIGALVGIISGVGAVIVAVIAIGALLIANWSSIKQWGIDTWNTIKETVLNFVEGCKTKFNEFTSFVSNIWNSITTTATNIWNGLVGIVSSVWTTICNVVQVGLMLIVNIFNAYIQLITLPFRFIWENCKGILISAWNSISSTVSSAVNTIKNIIMTVFNAIKSFIERVVNGWKNIITTVWNAIYNIISPILNKIKIKISTIFNAVKSTISNIWNSIKSTISNACSNIYNTVSSKFNAVKNKITNVINSAKSVVKSGLDKIKGFFSSCKLSFPNIKLPHFSISGKLSVNPPSVPKFSVKWYKTGGIMNNPTMFGITGVTAHVGGEAGAEAILPLDSFYNYLDNKLNKVNNTSNIDYDKLTDCFIKAIQTIDLSIKVGNDTFGKVSDKSTGKRAILLERGITVG